MNQTNRHVTCGCVCRLHGSVVTSSGETAVKPAFSLPQFTVNSWGQNFTQERQSTFTISHFYLFICLFFHLLIYFLKHKTVKTAVKERALVSQPVKSALYPSPSLSFCLLSFVSVLSIVLPTSLVCEHLAKHSTCQSLF